MDGSLTTRVMSLGVNLDRGTYALVYGFFTIDVGVILEY